VNLDNGRSNRPFAPRNVAPRLAHPDHLKSQLGEGAGALPRKVVVGESWWFSRQALHAARSGVYSITTWALYIPHRMFGKVNFHVIHVGKPGVLLQSIHPMHSKPWIGVLDSPL
jgi:hypothetical protein